MMQLTKGTIQRPGDFTASFARNVSHFMLALHLLLLVLAVADEAWATSSCSQEDETRIWTAPLVAQPEEKLQVLSVATGGELEELLVTDPAGRRAKLPAVKAGGPPWSLRGVLLAPARGSYRIEAMRAGRVLACAEVMVGGGTGNRGSGQWDVATQALYAAWIEHLFDAPPEESLSFPSLEPILRDPERNFLYDYLNRGEDRQLPAKPDCADLPYFLRAYFAWKLGLPISYRACNRGTASSPPRCDPPEIDYTFVRTAVPAGAFVKVSRRIMDRVTSGAGRTALRDDATDYYPVPLERSALWPGTVFADPYGHTLVIVKWVPQTEKRSGLLLAVDAQPDNTVTRDRFWEGNFLFAATPSAGPGFKAYRPPVSDGSRGGGWRPPHAALFDRAGGSRPRGLLRPYGAAHQPARTGPGRGLRGHPGCADGETRGPRALGRQRGSVHACPPGNSRSHAARPGHLRDHRPLGGLLDPVPGHAPADRHEGSGRPARTHPPPS